MKKKLLILYLIASQMSCENKSTICDVGSFKDLNLYPINCSISLPDYVVIDSVRYGSDEILSYDVKTKDSLFSVKCFVSISKASFGVARDINTAMMFQKKEVEFNRDCNLITEEISMIDTMKIGYFKYLIRTPTEKFYEARVVFYIHDKAVTFWFFEKFRSEELNNSSLSDCVYKTIKLNTNSKAAH